MVTAQTEHPPAEKLVAYGQKRLDDVESAEIEAHLATCSACLQVVEDTPVESLVETLREPVPAADEQAAESRPGLFTRLAAIVDPQKAKPEPRPVARPHLDVPAELRDHPRYEILEWLGAGGMGTVFMARHRLMDRVVALKVMNPRLLTEPVAVVRFQREVKAAAQLAHSHIVTAYDAEQVGGLHFLAMEYVEGQTLADVVDRHGPLPVHQACEYVRQAALGLQYAHEHGMVHRDIKPQNLVLTESGEVKVFDFGLARFVSETAEPGAESGVGKLLGSPDYMAPEQAGDAHRADIRADIYSLGCTLYHLLTGLPPFPGGNMVEKVAAHAGVDGQVHIWQPGAVLPIRDLGGPTGGNTDVAWCPDGERFAASGGTTIRLWDLSAGRFVRTLDGHTDSVNRVAWSPDGQRIATSSNDTTVRIWDAGDARPVGRRPGAWGVPRGVRRDQGPEARRGRNKSVQGRAQRRPAYAEATSRKP